MNLDLPPAISSRADLRALAEEIRDYARWYALAQVKKRFRAKSPENEPRLSPAASELLHDYLMKKPLSSTSLDELIKSLESFGAGASELTITLAAPITGSLKKTLVAWCRQNIAGDILVNFEFSSAILGGLILRYKSRVFDWTWRRQILENRGKFSEVLESV